MDVILTKNVSIIILGYVRRKSIYTGAMHFLGVK